MVHRVSLRLGWLSWVSLSEELLRLVVHRCVGGLPQVSADIIPADASSIGRPKSRAARVPQVACADVTRAHVMASRRGAGLRA